MQKQLFHFNSVSLHMSTLFQQNW